MALSVRRLFSLGLLGWIVATPALAGAQLSVPTPTQNPASTFVRGVDAAYDPNNNVYLVVGGAGHVTGVFVNPSGAPVSAPFAIKVSGGYGAFPRVAYSQHANGGSGGFLVAWSSEEPPTVRLRGRMVAYPGTLLGSETLISGPASSWLDVGALDLDYSPTSQRFFVAWKSFPNIDANGPNAGAPVRVYGVGVDNTANAIGTPVALSSGFARDPGVTWNPTNDDFGVSFSGETSTTVYSAFVRVPAANPAGFVRTAFNSLPATSAMTTVTDVAFSQQTGRYVMSWFQIDGGGLKAQVAEFDANATLLTTGVASLRIGSYDALSMAYNPVSGTHLLVGLDRANDAMLGAELNGNGYRFAAEQTLSASNLPARYIRVAPRTNGAQWLATFSGSSFTKIAAQAVSTGTTAGGPAGSYGGGGGGTPPPPPPPSTGCTTTNPGPAFSCVNGAWVYTGGTTTPPPTSSCTTPSPGTGWTCVSGNWLPPSTGGGSTTSCTTTNPGPAFSCVNGAWVYTGGTTTPPPTSSCTTPSPGTGWTCVSGNWLPPSTGGGSTTGCTTTNPGPAFSCVNGAWVYTGGTTTPPPPPVNTANGDFNRDGKSDLIFQNSSGHLLRRVMTGTQLTAEALLSTTTQSSAFRAVGFGDLTGDGNPDVLWQNLVNGQAYLNIMNGTALLTQQSIQTDDTAARVVGTGDIDADGNVDIVWHTPATGQVYVSFMRPRSGPSGFPIAGNAGSNNTHSGGPVVDGTGNALSIGGSSWIVGGLGDFNNDSRLDIAWQNSATGELRVWYLNGRVRYHDALITTVADLSWRLAVVGDVVGDTKLDVVWQHADGSLAFYTLTSNPSGPSTLNPVTVAPMPQAGAVSPGWRLGGAK